MQNIHIFISRRMGCRALYLWKHSLGKQPAAGQMQITGYGPTQPLPVACPPTEPDEDACPSPCPCLLHRDAAGMRACTAPGKILGDMATVLALASLQWGKLCLFRSAPPGAWSRVSPCRPPTRAGQSPRVAAVGAAEPGDDAGAGFTPA